MREALIDIKEHNVNPKKYEGRLLKDMTIGIIGCGKVGIKLGKIANSMGMKVLVSSYKEAPNFEKFCNVVAFDELLCKSDIIALHMPFTTETYPLPIAFIMYLAFQIANGSSVSSVELIDLEALYDNLKSGKVAGAGLDILESDYIKGKAKNLGNETMSSSLNNRITEKLLKMPNVIITPHIAYNTSDTINHVLETTINNIKDCQKGLYTNRVC